VIIPATLDGFKSRTAPPVELLVAEGVGPYPVDEGLEVEGPDEDVEVVLLAALAYGGRKVGNWRNRERAESDVPGKPQRSCR
jgi:hypothetical protein